MQFALVLSMVGVFHAAGAVSERRFPAMATALHTLGTIALGGGIYLAGQIFNLDEHWPVCLKLRYDVGLTKTLPNCGGGGEADGGWYVMPRPDARNIHSRYSDGRTR